MADSVLPVRGEEHPEYTNREVMVRDVGVGDTIMWAGIPVKVVDAKPQVAKGYGRSPKRPGRPGRYLICEVRGETRQLHYYLNECVEVVGGA